MSAPFKDYPADYFQNQLFPSNVFDLLPDDHDCFVYRDLFEQLDTSEVDAQYSRRGRHAYAPRQVVSILIYAYSHGVFSSRQIEKRCNEDLGFMHIAGKRCPNFRVLSDFRKDQGDFFRSCFKQTVQMAVGRKNSIRRWNWTLSPRSYPLRRGFFCSTDSAEICVVTSLSETGQP